MCCEESLQCAKEYCNQLATRDLEMSDASNIDKRFEIVKEIVHGTTIPKTDYLASKQNFSEVLTYLEQNVIEDLNGEMGSVEKDSV